MSKPKNTKRLIRRYTLADMLMHWSVAVGCVFLLLSGGVIFFDTSSTILNTDAGNLSRLIHRIAAIFFMGAPVLYFIFSKKRFGFLVAFKYDKSDLGWLKAAVKHYFVGGPLPPQGKYNTGQKLYYLVAVVCGILLAISGIFLWFDLASGTARLVMLVIHDVGAFALGAFLLVHVYLSAIHPRERVSFNAMVTGYMDRKYAEHSHELWVEEVEGKKVKHN